MASDEQAKPAGLKPGPYIRYREEEKASGFSLVADHDGGRAENGAELAGGESFEGAEAAFEFGRS